MKRDPRLKRSGERTDRWLGGQHRKPRYYPCPPSRTSVMAHIARGMRIPFWLLGGLGPHVPLTAAQAALLERERMIATAQAIAVERPLTLGDAADALESCLRLGPARVTFPGEPGDGYAPDHWQAT